MHTTSSSVKAYVIKVVVGVVNTQTINHGQHFPILCGMWQGMLGRRFGRRWHCPAAVVIPAAVETMMTT